MVKIKHFVVVKHLDNLFYTYLLNINDHLGMITRTFIVIQAGKMISSLLNARMRHINKAYKGAIGCSMLS